jgi:hypothetical protein
MLPPVSSPTADSEHPEAKTLSIEIEPSPSLILDMVQLLKNHNRVSQALELCRIALNHFPKDMGLRLGMALTYMDLNKKEEGRAELLLVAQEMKTIAPSMATIGRYFLQIGEIKLSEWFTLVANVLESYPEEKQEMTAVQPIQGKSLPEEMETSKDFPVSGEDLSLTMAEEHPEGKEDERKGPDGSKVLSSLNDWLTQLKGGQAKEEAL